MVLAAPIELVLSRKVDSDPGDQFVILLNRYERPLCGYLRVLVGDPDVVFDCAQDTFLRAYEHLAKGRSVNSQWMYKVARNLAIDHLRRQGRFHSDPEALTELIGQDQGVSSRTQLVREALAQLPLADRDLLYLSIVDRFKTEEIGTMLGIRAGAVRARLFRARERFRKAYGGST